MAFPLGSTGLGLGTGVSLLVHIPAVSIPISPRLCWPKPQAAVAIGLQPWDGNLQASFVWRV